MAAHGYHLQALLYCVALDRLLAQPRCRATTRRRHFGGVLYLFVRGVRPGWVAGRRHARRPALRAPDAGLIAARVSALVRQRGSDVTRVTDARPDAVPHSALAEGFARQVERWSRWRGAAPRTPSAARDAARSGQRGHVGRPRLPRCCATSQRAGRRARRGARRCSPRAWSARADAPGACPLVLDDDGRLYLHRYFDYERRLAARLARAGRRRTARRRRRGAARAARRAVRRRAPAAPGPTGRSSPPRSRCAAG